MPSFLIISKAGVSITPNNDYSSTSKLNLQEINKQLDFLGENGHREERKALRGLNRTWIEYRNAFCGLFSGQVAFPGASEEINNHCYYVFMNDYMEIVKYLVKVKIAP
jgi:hypothetical protein